MITAAAQHMERCIVGLQQQKAEAFRHRRDAARRAQAILPRLHRLMSAEAPTTLDQAQAIATVLVQLERIKLSDQAIELLIQVYFQPTDD